MQNNTRLVLKLEIIARNVSFIFSKNVFQTVMCLFTKVIDTNINHFVLIQWRSWNWNKGGWKFWNRVQQQIILKWRDPEVVPVPVKCKCTRKNLRNYFFWSLKCKLNLLPCMYFIRIPLDCRRYKAILLVTFRTLSGNRRTIMETCTKLHITDTTERWITAL